MFNRKYKKGIADAAKAYEAFGQKQSDALTHILKEFREGKRSLKEALDSLKGNVDSLYEHLLSKEKQELYTVYTPFDIKELGVEEQHFLLGALLCLSMDNTPSENQQNYLRAIQRYLEIKDLPFGVDPLAIENIENTRFQKAIFQVVIEFLQLQEGDCFDQTQLQQDFLEAFNLNEKAKQEIMDHVSMLYMATGAVGLAEKYGFVPEEDEEPPVEECEEDCTDTYEPERRIQEEDAAKKIYELCGGDISSIINTRDYALIYFKREGAPDTPRWLGWRFRSDPTAEDIDQTGLYAIDKHTGELSFVLPISKLPCGHRLGDICYYNNLLFALIYNDNDAELYLIDVCGKTIKKILRTAGRYYGSVKIMVVDEKNIVVRNFGETCFYVIEYNSCTVKRFSSQNAPHLNGKWSYYGKTLCTIRGGGMSMLSIDSLEQTKSILWQEQEESLLESAIICSDKVFLLQKTGEWGTRIEYGKDAPLGSIYDLISVEINNPNIQTVVLSDLYLKRVQHDASGWIMARFSSGNTTSYDWLYFDVTTEELHCITTDYADTYSEGHFSKKCTGIRIGELDQIGSVFFYKKTSGTVGSVHIEDLI